MKITKIDGVIIFDLWKKEVKKEMRSLVKALGLTKEEFNIHVFDNGCGDTLPEVTLHTTKFYIAFGPPLFSDCGDFSVMYRVCDGLKDYTGGQNLRYNSSNFNMGELTSWCRKVWKS
jgi:hypothetical protein